LDRIDLHVWVDSVEVSKLAEQEVGNQGTGPSLIENSREIREKVIKAREVQNKRFMSVKGMYTNGQMGNKQVKLYCPLSTETKQFLNTVAKKFDLSARAYFKVIKVARTIADLDGAIDISTSHVSEAVQYRENVW
jgi:magnesium chelatase family protein